MFPKQQYPKISRLINWLIQLVFFAGLYISLSYWQQKDMLAVGDSLQQPKFSLISVDGTGFTYDFANGKNRTLVYFFAPWCNVCHLSIDNLESIYQESNLSSSQTSNQKPKIILIALDWQTTNEVEDFLAQHKLSMPILLGTHQIQQKFKVRGFPSYYLISENAEVLSKSMGFSTELGMQLRLKLN
jgi:thiol-disulfide isomerase/thioredoxin